ncbi:MAG: D-alanine--D-alanine ligase [Saprospiraceae bacterium]|nr:D-alanine--D-alanine ligase [Saprospiraceae bacterium]
MIRIGILFGGPSREREIAFAGGRTVYDNLNKSVFEPVPIFIDSWRNWILLDWTYIYKGSIRDFYPPIEELPPSPHGFQIYSESLGGPEELDWDRVINRVGRRVKPYEVKECIDFAFLALHGEYGEDGQIQGLLESLEIPYTGSGIRACAIGMDKVFQKQLMQQGGFNVKPFFAIQRDHWHYGSHYGWFNAAAHKVGFPLVVRPANQGSSIGVSIVYEHDQQAFVEAVDRAFFRDTIAQEEWEEFTPQERIHYIQELSDIRSGLGYPVKIQDEWIHHPEALLRRLDTLLIEEDHRVVTLEAFWTEKEVVIEQFIGGKEFSCIVVRNTDGTPVALPPTEIIKGSEVFDYRSKYLPGLSRKETPIDLPADAIEAIRKSCEQLYSYFQFNTYARIDGFIENDGTILLNDPNTTSGMLPSSFFFHQAAEIGMNPSQFLTYIIRASLSERLVHSLHPPAFRTWVADLDQAIMDLRKDKAHKKKIAVIFGGYSFERHISVESGRNVFEKLSSSDKYEPTPVFLMGDEHQHTLYQIPINLLLKDNADDIRERIREYLESPESWHHPVIDLIREECAGLIKTYTSEHTVFFPRELTYPQLANEFDGAFIALHGRPGEDGTVQRQLDALQVPYNGSGYDSSQVTINKFETLRRLREAGFKTAEQTLVSRKEWSADPVKVQERLIRQYGFPVVIKPVDDGCSSAVKVIRDASQLTHYLKTIFREEESLDPESARVLKLKPKEEFPRKQEALVENLIGPEGAAHFMEITGGMVTHHGPEGIRFEVFEPSEALSGGEVLSLEEKFLAGEGQNITPARFATDQNQYRHISEQVKQDLERAARILGVEGYARIDAFVRIFADDRVETIIIEVNSLPGMTPATCIFHQSALNGYKPYEFIDQILEYAFHGQEVATIR